MKHLFQFLAQLKSREYVKRVILTPLRGISVSVLHPGIAIRNLRLALREAVRFWRQFKTYSALSKEKVAVADFYPCLHDRTVTSGVLDGIYSMQDHWAARRIHEAHPVSHFDIGSSREFLLMVSVFTPTVMLDIRPMGSSIVNLTGRTGDVLDLPMEDNSVESISSLSVIEHIGLGRYGGALDPAGTVKAARELSRVLAPGGRLYVAVPVEGVTRVHFNAHRTFTPEDFVALFPDLRLVEEIHATNDTYYSREQWREVGEPYVYGCFLFTKD